MKTIEAARHAMEHGCSLMRARKGTAHEWDVKEAFSGSKRGWFYMDTLTASMLVAVYEALKGSERMSQEEARAKFNRIPLTRLIDFGWKHAKAA
jgi:hypothetical protein